MSLNDIVCIEGLNYDSNCYLIYDMLIDTGTGLNPDYIYNELKKYDLEIDDIALIVNTHCHFDHVGGNYHFPNAKVAIHEADSQALKDKNNRLTAIDLLPDVKIRHDVDIELKNNDMLGDFEVIHTPGHTPGGICLWDGECLISGDTVFANGGIGRMDIGGNLEDMTNSLRKLKELDVEYLLPGHGVWTDNGKKHIELSASQLL